MCWNAWQEKNRRIFSDLASSYDACSLHTYSNILLWTRALSDKERLHLSEDNSADDLLSPRQLSGSEVYGCGDHRFPCILFLFRLYVVCFLLWLYFGKEAYILASSAFGVSSVLWKEDYILALPSLFWFLYLTILLSLINETQRISICRLRSEKKFHQQQHCLQCSQEHNLHPDYASTPPHPLAAP